MLNYLDQDAKLIRDCLPTDTDVPDNSTQLFRLYAVLLRSKGTETLAEDVHDAWSVWMLGIDPEHDSIRPYAELDVDTKTEDSPFLAAIRRAAQLRADRA